MLHRNRLAFCFGNTKLSYAGFAALLEAQKIRKAFWVRIRCPGIVNSQFLIPSGGVSLSVRSHVWESSWCSNVFVLGVMVLSVSNCLYSLSFRMHESTDMTHVVKSSGEKEKCVCSDRPKCTGHFYLLPQMNQLYPCI